MQTTALKTSKGFDSLNLIDPLCRAVNDEDYSIPTPIQMQAVPPLLEGRDLLGCAQTGTGKTAAFALPILQRLIENYQPAGHKGVRSLILTPTRELALQISESFEVYGRYLNLKQTVIYGGVRQEKQVKALKKGVDILVATPGRLLDLYNQKYLDLNKVEVFVLDEADRMLDMGFLPDVKKINSFISKNCQTMLFSATMPMEIQRLTKSFLNDPVKVEVAPPSTTVDKIDQRVLFVDRENKGALLNTMLQDEAIERALIFARTRHGANRIVRNLSKSKIKADAIHGNKSQAARLEALNKFKTGKVRVLVATDIASRGIDVDGITHVINYELPNEPESYVHRIGRTARAGAAGMALSLCDLGELGYLKKIERATKIPVEMMEDHIYHSETIASKRGRSSSFKSRTSQKKRFYGPRTSSRKNNRPPSNRIRRQRGRPSRSRKA
ncbi:MAG: DEAD/DEAH box helicase [Nitrospinae bacterium]|nr:DEAD/DEAH box helicase [Nitrospinota bacterium]